MPTQKGNKMSLKQRLTTAVIATATLTAQSTTIIGNVRDAETGEALIGVTIAVSNTTKGAASDLDGNYSLGNLGAGTYTLRASYLSYETQEQTITYDDPDGTRKTITTHKGDLALDFYGINKSNGFRYEFVGNEPL